MWLRMRPSRSVSMVSAASSGLSSTSRISIGFPETAHSVCSSKIMFIARSPSLETIEVFHFNGPTAGRLLFLFRHDGRREQRHALARQVQHNLAPTQAATFQNIGGNVDGHL